eukprot:m.252833 g.252833  ORF g.252833 m.252833 type:complete len:668 (+) comp15923_c0_seq2:181-2184(+)
MSRAVPWRSKCPAVVTERLQNFPRMLCVSKPGPTSFIVQVVPNEPVAKKRMKYRVRLGTVQTCSCPGFHRDHELCVHILWVMVKVMRVSPTNPLCHQLALVEREINQLLAASAAASAPPVIDHQGTAASVKTTVQPKPIEPDDVCPICQDNLEGTSEPLTHCGHGCGGRVHVGCVLEWGRHAVSSGEKCVRCPLCRADMGSLGDIERIARRGVGETARKLESRVHRGATCRGCGESPVAGTLYRCDTCAGYELCHGCHSHGAIHPPHSFSKKRTPRARWEPVLLAPLLPEPMVRRLEAGEIGEEAYDVLLQLDRNATAEAHPLASNALARLPVERVTAATLAALPSGAADGRCGVCDKPYTAGEHRRRLPCAHWYHVGCIDPWLKVRDTCPIDGACARVEAPPPPHPKSKRAVTAAAAAAPPQTRHARAAAGQGQPSARSRARHLGAAGGGRSERMTPFARPTAVAAPAPSAASAAGSAAPTDWAAAGRRSDSAEARGGSARAKRAGAEGRCYGKRVVEAAGRRSEPTAAAAAGQGSETTVVEAALCGAAAAVAARPSLVWEGRQPSGAEGASAARRNWASGGCWTSPLGVQGVLAGLQSWTLEALLPRSSSAWAPRRQRDHPCHPTAAALRLLRRRHPRGPRPRLHLRLQLFQQSWALICRPWSPS